MVAKACSMIPSKYRFHHIVQMQDYKQYFQMYIALEKCHFLNIADVKLIVSVLNLKSEVHL